MSRSTKDFGRHSGIRANESMDRKPVAKIRAAARQAGQDEGPVAGTGPKKALTNRTFRKLLARIPPELLMDEDMRAIVLSPLKPDPVFEKIWNDVTANLGPMKKKE